jgi:acetyltransferase
VLAADALADLNGALAELKPSTVAELNRVLPPTWSGTNPVDIIGDAGAQRYEDALSALMADAASDAILVMNCPTALASSADAAAVVVREAAAHESQHPRKVLLTSWLGDGAAAASRRMFVEARIPTFETPEAAVEGLMQLVRYRRAQDELMQVPPSANEAMRFDSEGAHRILEDALAAGRSILSEVEAKALLASYGIPVVVTLIAADPADVEAKAREVLREHPACVVKVLSDDITHKSDIGGVRLALTTPSDARTAAEEILASVKRLRPAAVVRGFTVQAMIARAHAHELIIGASEDATVGPLMMFGAGGTSVEVTADTSHALPPLDIKLARQMMQETRIYRLLRGYRDRPAADIEAIALALVRLSYLVAEHGEIREIDINPLLADERGVVALDARVSVADPAKRPRVPLAVRPYPVEWERVQRLDAIGDVMLRPIRPDDEPKYEAFFARIAVDDLRMRFFTAAPDRSFRFFARMTQIDYAREMAFVAAAPDELLGVARLVADPDYRNAEFAVIVRSDLKGKGLGTALMQQLIAYARAEGLDGMQGDVLLANTGMLNLCRQLGFALDVASQGDVVRVRISLQ